GTSIDAAEVGFDPRVETDYGVMDANGADVAISKLGPGSWSVETEPINLGADSLWRVEEGTLELVGAGAWGGAKQAELAGGTFVVTAEPLTMTDVNFTVTGNATLQAETSSDADLGILTLEAGTATFAGAPGGIDFEKTDIDGAAVGVRLETGTDLGPINVLSAGPTTFSKSGPAPLVLTSASRGTGWGDTLTIDAAGGPLVVVNESNPVADTLLQISGGELILANDGTDDPAHFDNPLTVTDDGTLTAGTGGLSVSGPPNVKLGSPAKDVDLQGNMLTLRTTDGYTLEVAGPLSGDGSVETADAGTAAVLSGGGSVASISVSGGELATTAALTATSVDVSGGTFAPGPGLTDVDTISVTGGMLAPTADVNAATMTVKGGTVSAGENRVNLSDSLIIDRVTYSSDAVTFGVQSAGELEKTNIIVDELDSTLTMVAPVLGAFPDLDGLAIHLDASAISGIPDGDPVAVWPDISGNDRPAVTEGPVQQPTYKAFGINGVPSVYFSGPDPVAAPHTNSDKMHVPTDQTIQEVWVVTTLEEPFVGRGVDGCCLVLIANGNDYQKIGVDCCGFGGSFWGPDEGGGDENFSNGGEFFIDGVDQLVIPLETPFIIDVQADSPTNMDDLSIGDGTYPWGYDEQGRVWHGHIGEIIMYDRALSGEERELVGAYLSSKYGVDTAYPAPPPGGGLVADAYITVTENATILPDTDGPATISGLAVDNATAILGAGPSGYILGTAGGQGTIQGDFSLTGTLAPGDGVGTLSITGNLTMEDGSNYDWELGAEGNDIAAVSGVLTLPGVGEEWTLTLFDAGAPLGPPPAELVVFTYGSLDDDPPGTLGNYDVVTSNVDHWIFSGDPTLEVVGNEIHLMGLSMIVALQWDATGDGLYSAPANWIGGVVPNDVDDVANFLEKITTDSEVTVDVPATVGTINFKEEENSYTIAGPETITFETSGGDAQINVELGHHTISAPLLFAATLPALTVATEESTSLTVNLGSTSVVTTDLTKTGAGTWVVNGGRLLLGEIDAAGGTLQLDTNLLGLPGGNVSIADGATLKTSGEVNRRVSGVPGDTGLGIVASTLELTGATEIGLVTETDGHVYQGALEVGPHFLGLEDADEAPLYGA
ncbi:MAG: hypothetical protein ACYSWU_15090, partial [Planctomycetota bacterium]